MHSQYAYYRAGAAKTEAGGKAPKTDPDRAACLGKVLGKTVEVKAFFLLFGVLMEESGSEKMITYSVPYK
jgi:hypothetical protein